MSPSPVVTLQLLLVRSLFDRAEMALRENSDVGNMTAMLLADVAVETVIKEALVEKQEPVGKEDKLHLMLPALEKAVPTMRGLPELGMATRLRAARNPVQHSGSVPTTGSVAGHLHDAECFIEVTMKHVFGVDFGDVSAVALVRSNDIRSALDEASRLLAAGEVNRAALHVAAAFTVLRVRWGRWVSQAVGGEHERLAAYLPLSINREVFDVFGNHPDGLETVQEGPLPELALLSMGFSLIELIVLRKLGDLSKKARAREQGTTGQLADPSDVGFGIEAVARNTWRLEAAHPELFATVREAPEPPAPSSVGSGDGDEPA